MKRTSLYWGDALTVSLDMDADSVDAVVTDPPYGLGFMGKNWDHGIPGVPFWEAVLRAAKPGAHLLAFGGTRTHHRLMCAIEDAGWEIRDCLMWVYGSGFPKSLDVGRAIDKVAGAKREVVGPRVTGDGHIQNRRNGTNDFGTFKIAQDGIDMATAPATDAAKQWDGWGTALKPAWEPIILARKPLTGTVAANVQEHGTGGLNIDGCRIQGSKAGAGSHKMFRLGGTNSRPYHDQPGNREAFDQTTGRWPANVVHDGSEEVVGRFPDTAGGYRPDQSHAEGESVFGKRTQGAKPHNDSGSAARFFYCAKASRSEREAGLESGERQFSATMGKGIGGREHDPSEPRAYVRNTHPTVKPLALMRWLCRLVTPPNGLILDPFCGSGSTGVAAALEGFRFIGIDDNPDYYEIAHKRIAAATAQRDMFHGEEMELEA